jgi:hypothetical protein
MINNDDNNIKETSQINSRKSNMLFYDSNFLNDNIINEIGNDSLYILDIDLSNNKKEKLSINKNNDLQPEEISYNFCKEKNLDFKTMQKITNEIRNLLNKDKKILNYKNIYNTIDTKNIDHFNNSIPKFSSIKKNNKMNYGEYLYLKGKDYKKQLNEKIEKIKKERYKESSINLTFHPKLYKSRSYTTIQASPNLYINKPKKNNITPFGCTFKPKINNNIIIKENFNERLIKYNQSSEKKKKELSLDKNKFYDEITKKPFFTPNLISRYKFKTSRRNVFQSNYDYASLYKRNKEELSYSYLENEIKPNIIKNNSEKIFNDRKKKCFKYIFNILDKDQDGFISSINLNNKNFTDELNIVIEPVISQIIQQNAIIEEKNFIKAMNVLFSALSIRERQIILNVKKNILTNLENNYNKSRSESAKYKKIKKII